MKIQYSLMHLCLIIFSTLMPAQTNWRESQAKKDRLMYKANTAILNFERTDSELKNFFDRAYRESIIYEQKAASAMLPQCKSVLVSMGWVRVQSNYFFQK